MTTETLTSVSVSPWIAPEGVTSVEVICQGAGSAGGVNASFAEGGGGGGARSITNSVTVVPGQPYTFQVGLTGVPGAVGGDTFFSTTGVAPTQVSEGCLAKGGGAAATGGTVAGTGGQAAAGIGDTKFSGGHGAAGNPSTGGGGGGSAGSASNGNNAGTRPAGGIAVAGGTAGGDGGTAGQNGNNGGLGSGGGGGGSNPGAAGLGGNGFITLNYSAASEGYGIGLGFGNFLGN